MNGVDNTLVTEYQGCQTRLVFEGGFYYHGRNLVGNGGVGGNMSPHHFFTPGGQTMFCPPHFLTLILILF